jgi:hypothetical protein
MHLCNIETLITVTPNCSHVMASNHTTVEPEQTTTDTFAVFRDETDFHGHLELIASVDVPRYSQPNETGVKLDTDKRLSLAVARAVESADSFIASTTDPFVELDEYETIEGEKFGVMRELGGGIEWVAYEQNPTFDGVWDPEENDD